MKLDFHLHWLLESKELALGLERALDEGVLIKTIDLREPEPGRVELLDLLESWTRKRLIIELIDHGSLVGQKIDVLTRTIDGLETIVLVDRQIDRIALLKTLKERRHVPLDLLILLDGQD